MPGKAASYRQAAAGGTAKLRLPGLSVVVQMPCRLDTLHPEFATLEVFEVELSRGG